MYPSTDLCAESVARVCSSSGDMEAFAKEDEVWPPPPPVWYGYECVAGVSLDIAAFADMLEEGGNNEEDHGPQAAVWLRHGTRVARGWWPLEAWALSVAVMVV